MGEKKPIEKIYSAFFEQEFPADLIVVVLWLAVSIIAGNLPPVNQTTVPVIFAVPVLLLIPGYCFIVALFPKNDDIGLAERIALSMGISIKKGRCKS